MESGFIWACEYGRAEVADFLLQMGVDKNTSRQYKLTGLHWAAASGDLPTVKAVLTHNPPIEAPNVWAEHHWAGHMGSHRTRSERSSSAGRKLASGYRGVA